MKMPLTQYDNNITSRDRTLRKHSLQRPTRIIPTLGSLFRKGAQIMFSFEATFVLFLFAGTIKADDRLSWLPVDMTGLFFVVSVLLGLGIIFVSYVGNRARISQKLLTTTILMLYLLTYLIFTLFWTPSVAYSRQKAFYLVTIVLWAFLGSALIIAKDRRRINRFLSLILLFSLYLAFESILVFFSKTRPGAINLSTSYIGIGRVIGLGLLVSLIYWETLIENHTRLESLLMFTIILFLGGALLMVGARGPLVAVLGSLLFLGFRRLATFSLRSRRTRRYLFLIGWIAIGGLLLYRSDILLPSISRLSKLLRDNEHLYRLVLFENGLHLFIEKPLTGHGIGAWPILTGYYDIKEYPHNIFVEFLVESGIIGFGLFSAVLVRAWKNTGPIFAIHGDKERTILLMLLCFTLINALFSGDIPDNRMIFVAVGLTVVRWSDHQGSKYRSIR